MVFPWFSHGFPMVFPWFSYGFPMVFLWFSYRLLRPPQRPVARVAESGRHIDGVGPVGGASGHIRLVGGLGENGPVPLKERDGNLGKLGF